MKQDIGFSMRSGTSAVGAIAALLLAACGGGGGSDASAPLAPGVDFDNISINPTATCDLAGIGSAALSADAPVTVLEVSTGTTGAAATDREYCLVKVRVDPQVNIWVSLPTSNWNGRFRAEGNGVYAGNVNVTNDSVRQGFVGVMTDTGHAGSPLSGAFGMLSPGNPNVPLQEDFAHRSMHLAAVVGKQLTKAYYAQDPVRSYWYGCSTGGRQGLMEAQRFQDDFDGYAVGAPVYNYVRQQLSAPALLGNLYKNGITGGSELPPAKRDLIGNIVYNGNGGNYPGCDAVDGVVDGQIRNPLKCNFNPAVHVPLCSGGDAPDCLTFSELQAVQGVYAGKPEFGVLPLPVGSETTSGGWGSWLITNNGSAPTLHGVMVDAFQYLLFEPDRPTFDYLTQLNWGSDPYMMEKAKQTYNATNPDLRTFAANGKKIIMYHGWTDPGVNPMGTLEYKASVEQTFGNQNAVDAFMKLYMVPGLGHCNGGPGHTQIDWMAPLTKWVEEGSAPVAIVGTKPGTSSTRPHCPHPTEAVYDGTGDPDLAASYACRLP